MLAANMHAKPPNPEGVASFILVIFYVTPLGFQRIIVVALSNNYVSPSGFLPKRQRK
jgi:hypothetical protein